MHISMHNGIEQHIYTYMYRFTCRLHNTNKMCDGARPGSISIQIFFGSLANQELLQHSNIASLILRPAGMYMGRMHRTMDLSESKTPAYNRAGNIGLG